AAETPALPLSTRETVASLTPAWAAMSARRGEPAGAPDEASDAMGRGSVRPPDGGVTRQLQRSVRHRDLAGGQQQRAGRRNPHRALAGVGGADEHGAVGGRTAEGEYAGGGRQPLHGVARAQRRVLAAGG